MKATIKPLSFLRKAVSASASATRDKNVIHFLAEVDVTKVLESLERIKSQGKRVSLTVYVAKAFASVITEYKWMNSFVTRGKQVFLEDVAISILVERNIDGMSVPEPMVVHDADKKTVWDIAEELEKAKEKAKQGKSLGDLTGSWYFRFIPGWLLKTFVRMADRSIAMGIKYGKLAVTSMGMFSSRAIWVVPHGSATVLLSIGTTSEGKKLHLTVSFDHDIVDGAPAVRFTEALCSKIEKCEELQSVCSPDKYT